MFYYFILLEISPYKVTHLNYTQPIYTRFMFIDKAVEGQGWFEVLSIK